MEVEFKKLIIKILTTIFYSRITSRIGNPAKWITVLRADVNGCRKFHLWLGENEGGVFFSTAIDKISLYLKNDYWETNSARTIKILKKIKLKCVTVVT